MNPPLLLRRLFLSGQRSLRLRQKSLSSGFDWYRLVCDSSSFPSPHAILHRKLCAFERGGDGDKSLEFQSDKTPYKVLDLPRHATPDQIRTQYRKLVRKYHPDSGSADASSDMMANITSAYEALTRGSSLYTAKDSRVANKVHGSYSIEELLDDDELDVKNFISLDDVGDAGEDGFMSARAQLIGTVSFDLTTAQTNTVVSLVSGGDSAVDLFAICDLPLPIKRF